MTHNVAALRKVGEVAEACKSWDQLLVDGTGFWNLQPRSPLVGDNQKAKAYPISSRARLAIIAAVDHLTCFRESFITSSNPDDMRVKTHIYAQFSLLRNVIGNASIAAHLLGAKKRNERILRRIRIERSDMTNLENLRARMQKMSHLPAALAARWEGKIKERKQKLENLAQQCGHTGKLKAVHDSEMVETAGEEQFNSGQHYLVRWSMCSAFAHGDEHTVALFMNVEPLATTAATSTITRQIAASDDYLLYATLAAIKMLKCGIELYKIRAQAP